MNTFVPSTYLDLVSWRFSRFISGYFLSLKPDIFKTLSIKGGVVLWDFRSPLFKMRWKKSDLSLHVLKPCTNASLLWTQRCSCMNFNVSVSSISGLNRKTKSIECHTWHAGVLICLNFKRQLPVWTGSKGRMGTN